MTKNEYNHSIEKLQVTNAEFVIAYLQSMLTKTFDKSLR